MPTRSISIPSTNLSRTATARRVKSCLTLAQVRAMIDFMAKRTDIEKRTARSSPSRSCQAPAKAIVSFRLKHIDIEPGLIEQDSREVRTKRAKTFTTWFFPVGDDIRQIVVDWVTFLRDEKEFRTQRSAVPKTKVAPGYDLAFRAVSLDRSPWANAKPLFARFSAKPVRGRDCLILIRTSFGTRWFRSPMTESWMPKPSRRGRKTLGMRAP